MKRKSVSFKLPNHKHKNVNSIFNSVEILLIHIERFQSVYSFKLHCIYDLYLI